MFTNVALADDAEITVDINQIGSSTAGKGLKNGSSDTVKVSYIINPMK
jgi:hypothetical protein